jgi:hypothetical protein
MLKLGGPLAVAALLSFNGGFVDTSGFLGLQGLFTSRETSSPLARLWYSAPSTCWSAAILFKSQPSARALVAWR